LALAASGCGKNNSTSAAQAAGALSKMMQTSRSFALSSHLQDAKQRAEGQLLFQRFEAEAQAIRQAQLTSLTCSDFSTQTSATCNAGSVTLNDANGAASTAASCTATCSSSTATVACTLSGSITQTCGANTFTFQNGSINATVPPATCTQSGNTISLAFSFGLNFKVDVKGGDLSDFTTLQCNFANSFKLNLDATTGSASGSSSDISGSTNYSCSLGGNAISQDDLSKAMAANAC
jgi:hypothetical protein